MWVQDGLDNNCCYKSHWADERLCFEKWLKQLGSLAPTLKAQNASRVEDEDASGRGAKDPWRGCSAVSCVLELYEELLKIAGSLVPFLKVIY